MSAARTDYAAQLRHIAHSLAVGKNDHVTDDISERDTVEKVYMFTSGNLEKRFDKLKDEAELLEDELENLEDLIVRYVREQPLQAYDTGTSDVANFMKWLGQEIDLTPEQRDLTVVLRSRTATEEVGRRNRLAHVRFQELRSLVEELAAELGINRNLRIRLNPVRLWAVFESTLFLDEDDDPTGGVEVLFYAFGNEVRTAVLEPEARTVMRTLGECEPCSLEELYERVDLTAGVSKDELQEILLDSADTGLIAFS